MAGRQGLSSKLAKAQRFKKAQARVANLEAQVVTDQSNFTISEERYQRLFDNLLEGCQLIDFDWRYLYVNHSAARYGGQTPNDLLGHTVLECYPGIADTELFAVLRYCMTDRIAQVTEFEFTYPDGSRVWLEFRIQPVLEGVFVLMVDITKRKEAEAAALTMLGQDMKYLAVSERWPTDYRLGEQPIVGRSHHELSEELARYSQTVEAMRRLVQTTLDAFPANTTVLDPDGTIITVNLPWKHFADENDTHSPTHYLGSNYLTVCDTAAGPMAEEAAAAAVGIRAVIAGQQDDFYLEYPCHSPTQERWFTLRVTPFAEPAPRRVVVAHINITERKAAEQAEREQRLLAEALRDSLAVLTTSLKVETVMQQLLAYSATVIPSEAGTIILFEGNQGRIAYARGHTAEAEAFFKATLIRLDSGKFAQGYHQAAYLAADTHSTPGWISFPVTAWVRSSIGVPIILRGETIGLLIADSGIPNRFQPKDAERLQTFAQYAALALENAQHVDHLEQRVRERTTELQIAKERVEAILNNSGDGILLVHPDFTIQQTNAAFNRLFACETDAYFNQPLATLFQAEDGNLMTKTIQTGVVEGTTVNLEVLARRQDDTAFDAELTVGFIKKGGFVCSIRDITERKAQERQLRYHASLQENVSDAVIVTDLDFCIQSWNRAAERIYGWQTEEVIGQVTAAILRTQFASPADRERNIQQLHEQGWWQGEIIQHHKDGSIRHILGSVTLVKDESGAPFSIVSINHDITERKRTENELAEERNRLRSLIDTVPDFIYIKDLQHRFVLCNQAFALAHGHQTPDEMIHKSDFDYFPAELAEQFQADEVEILHMGKTIIDQEEFVNGYRGFTWVSSSKFPLRNLNGKIIGLVGTTRDISERKQTEAALQKSAAEIHDLYNHAPCGYHSINQDGVIVQINDTELRWLGYNRDEVINKLAIKDIITPESVKIFQKSFPILKERGWLHGLEFDIIRKDSSIMHLLLNATAIYDEKGQYLQSRSSVFDITSLKQAQQALVESEARYRLLAENIGDVIIKSDINGIRTFVTPSATTLTGYSPKELIEGVTLELVHPDDRLASESILLQALNSAESSCILTQRVHHKEGHYVWVEVTTSIVCDASTGKPTELISVFRDITERKRAEAILNARLEEEHEFQGYLKALHEITIELTQIDELDAFYQRAVELGLARLGFERLAMFLYNEKDKTALGTYGTDTQGKVVDERHIQFAPNPNGPMLRAFNQAQRFYFDENVPLYNDLQPVGFGWNAAAVLWNGTRSLGWFVADNLLYQMPASKPLLNVMGLYALTVGTLLAQKQVQIELRESEARYRLLAENITDVVMCTNAALECVYISPSSRTVLGYEPAELVGQFALTHIHPDDLASVEQALAASMQKNLPDLTLIVRYRHKRGHYVWLESTGRVIRSEKSGEVEGFISSSRDISKRKQAEEALRESEEKFRLLLDAAPVATIISDQMGRITLVNIQAETLFRFTRAELVGQMVEILVPEHAHDLHMYNRATYMAAPRVRQAGIGLEVFARRKDGSEFPVEIELSYIQTKDGILVMSFVLDITERRRIAAELESQRSFLRSVIDVSPSMIFVKDYNARFVLVNPMTAKLYNTTVEALIGKTDADFNPSLEEVEHYLEADRRVIDTGELLFVEEPISNFAGETHWLQTTKVPIIGADGKSTYVLGVATDITERRRAEAALQASEEKYRRLVETMQGGLAIFDLDDRITYVNDRFCALLGYSRDELIGSHSYDHMDDTNIHIIDAQLKRRRNLESSSYEILVRHKEGRSVHLLVSASPLLDKNGEYSGSFAVTTDISAQKQAEATLQQALAQEKELGELKSRFVSMASHEFRTPLATILALTETLSAYRNRLSEAQIEQRFDKIKDQVGHLRDIMEDVLLLARMQARRVESNPVNLDLDALCRTVLDEFQNRADVKHRLNYECSESGRKVTLDPKLMRQIISNLVSNAIKYSADDKPIHITLEFVDETITIKVRDEGIGIPEADLKHLFEPFHRAANVGNIPGTGLGLVITRESVELLGGTIAVESQVARGTTFTIHIPIST